MTYTVAAFLLAGVFGLVLLAILGVAVWVLASQRRPR